MRSSPMGLLTLLRDVWAHVDWQHIQLRDAAVYYGCADKEYRSSVTSFSPPRLRYASKHDFHHEHDEEEMQKQDSVTSEWLKRKQPWA